MKTWLFLLTVGCFMGCTTVQNTPAQDRVWAAYPTCRAGSPGVQIDRVESDGTYHYRGYGFSAFNECMRDEMQRQRRDKARMM